MIYAILSSLNAIGINVLFILLIEIIVAINAVASTGPIKFKSEKSNQKTVFRDLITGIYCEGVLRKFKAAVIIKKQIKLQGGILFHHDNAPAHSSLEFDWKILPHSPYSSDFVPSDCFSS